MEKKSYFATTSGFINGNWYDAGAAIQLTPRQAQYLILAGTISDTAPAAKNENAAPERSKNDQAGKGK